MMWERVLINECNALFVPVQARNLVRVSLRKVIEWIKTDRKELKGRNRFLLAALKTACEQLEKNSEQTSTVGYMASPLITMFLSGTRFTQWSMIH